MCTCYKEGRLFVSDLPNVEVTLLVGVNSVFFLGRTVSLLEEFELSVKKSSVHVMRHNGDYDKAQMEKSTACLSPRLRMPWH